MGHWCNIGKEKKKRNKAFHSIWGKIRGRRMVATVKDQSERKRGTSTGRQRRKKEGSRRKRRFSIRLRRKRARPRDILGSRGQEKGGEFRKTQGRGKESRLKRERRD